RVAVSCGPGRSRDPTRGAGHGRSDARGAPRWMARTPAPRGRAAPRPWPSHRRYSGRARRRRSRPIVPQLAEPGLQLRLHLGVSGVVRQVLQLVRIGDQVVELGLAGLVLDPLELLVPDARERRWHGIVVLGVAVEPLLVEEVGAPRGLDVVEEAHHAAPV